jgi:hypothetical protein
MGSNIPGPVLGLVLFLVSAMLVVCSVCLRALYLAMRDDYVPRDTSGDGADESGQ